MDALLWIGAVLLLAKFISYTTDAIASDHYDSITKRAADASIAQSKAAQDSMDGMKILGETGKDEL